MMWGNIEDVKETNVKRATGTSHRHKEHLCPTTGNVRVSLAHCYTIIVYQVGLGHSVTCSLIGCRDKRDL